MRRLLVSIVVLLFVVGVVGCQELRASRQPKSGEYQQRQPVAGLVPVHLENPSLLSQEVCIFEGGPAIKLVPGTRPGEWQYSRPPFVCYEVDRANSKNNWHKYAEIYLPRNASFILVGRERWFLGLDAPYFVSFRTGNDPYAVRYWSVTPAQREVYCGALVRLRTRPASSRPLNIKIDIDARPIGAAITNRLTEAIYGNER